MTRLMDLRWQDYEIENQVPSKKTNGEPKLDRNKIPVVETVKTGIKMKIKPLSYEGNQLLMTFMQKVKGTDYQKKLSKTEQQKQTVSMMNSPDFPKILRQLLPDHVKDITGIEVIDEKTEKKRNVTIEDIVTYGAFMATALSVFTKLSLISNLSEVENDALKKK